MLFVLLKRGYLANLIFNILQCKIFKKAPPLNYIISYLLSLTILSFVTFQSLGKFLLENIDDGFFILL